MGRSPTQAAIEMARDRDNMTVWFKDDSDEVYVTAKYNSLYGATKLVREYGFKISAHTSTRDGVVVFC